MSEPAAKRPMDLEDFERRLRAPEPAPQVAGHDPLAELARLVDGNRDPYADMFGRPNAHQPRANLPGLRAVKPQNFEPEAPATPAQVPPSVEVPGAQDWQIRREEWPPSFPQARAAAPAIEAPTAAPEMSYEMAEPDYAEAPAPKKSRKAFYLMAASLAAVVAGVGATVLTRGGSHTSQDAPIIKAAQGPMKVQPEQTAASAEPTRTASVLDRSADKLGPTKVVNREEQPIDLGGGKVVRQPSQAQAPAAAPPAQTSNLFPEPRKVRTIPVRPDGSLATDADVAKPSTVAAIPAPTPAPATRTTSTASVTPLQMPKATPATPSASAPAPKTTARVAPPEAPRTQTAARPMALTGASDPSPVASTPKQVASGSKPTALSSGGFSVQLAAAGSDSEAREKAGKFASQFSGAINGRRPAVVHGEANGKSVYRVRITGLSKDDAASMCGRIKQGGGACFVAAN